jgi:hypothetical protein
MDTPALPATTIAIERMIFHLVGPDLPKADLLEEFDDLSSFREFFEERLDTALKGVKYEFLSLSGTREALKETLDPKKPNAFVKNSEAMAERFQEIAKMDNRITAGALLFFIFRADGGRRAAVLKFDDQRVIRYSTKPGSKGRKLATLTNVLHTFVKDKSAMQKAAVLWTDGDDDVLLCTDRAGKSGDITDRFREYLGVKRSHTHSELTKLISEVLVATGRKCKGELPDEVRTQLLKRTHDALRKLEAFDPDDPAPLLNAVFGPIAADSEIPKEFARGLKKRKIQDEPISFDPDVLPTATKKIRETIEGVQVIYTDENVKKGVVTFNELAGGKKCPSSKYLRHARP